MITIVKFYDFKLNYFMTILIIGNKNRSDVYYIIGAEYEIRKTIQWKRTYLQLVFLCTIQLMFISSDDIIDTPYTAWSLMQHADYRWYI